MKISFTQTHPQLVVSSLNSHTISHLSLLTRLPHLDMRYSYPWLISSPKFAWGTCLFGLCRLLIPRAMPPTGGVRGIC